MRIHVSHHTLWRLASWHSEVSTSVSSHIPLSVWIMRGHLIRKTIWLMTHRPSKTSARRHSMLALGWSSKLVHTVSAMTHTATILTARMLALQVRDTRHVSSKVTTGVHPTARRASSHGVHIVAVSIHRRRVLVILISISLRGVVHFDWSAHYYFTLHFLKSSFRLFF